ncbi:hypothetical protein GBAR_LOCUS19087 [Geodia barretti]|uniref:Uncharacterized protein n=1 Tax=Geodia barretti TaxID=519541 RepID=A0AA35SPH5_GEOBA|nr:hypothetical protein GBAR_LOCUS19087 [Geodia barretti]
MRKFRKRQTACTSETTSRLYRLPKGAHQTERPVQSHH